MSSMTVAAVIPLYNGAAFIEDALQSVVAQREAADEIIVVNDGSTDGGVEIVEAMARRHPITLLHKKNGGQSSARNLAIRHCRSSHIAFLDQDDLWYEDHIQILKAPYLGSRHSRLGLVYGNLDQIDRNGRMVQYSCLNEVPTPQPKRSLVECLVHDMFILPGASLVLKEAVVKAGGFDERLVGYEDDDLFIRIFSLGYFNEYVNKAVTQWRIYPGSTSFSTRMAESRVTYFRKLIESYPDEPRLGRYWVRDAIGPHFFGLLFQEFIEANRTSDLPRMERAWSDLKIVVEVLKPKTKRRFHAVQRLIDVLYRTRLSSVCRPLIRYANH
jgi:glycosyltransferase involved in cell wall biosynthesis